MIDLNTCKKGDILISSHGLRLEYVSKTPWRHYTYLDHVVKYPDDVDSTNKGTRYKDVNFGKNNYGTRTNDGFTFSKNRVPETDNDIVEIIRI